MHYSLAYEHFIASSLYCRHALYLAGVLDTIATGPQHRDRGFVRDRAHAVPILTKNLDYISKSRFNPGLMNKVQPPPQNLAANDI